MINPYWVGPLLVYEFNPEEPEPQQPAYRKPGRLFRLWRRFANLYWRFR